jgi:hypothetical protein
LRTTFKTDSWSAGLSALLGAPRVSAASAARLGSGAVTAFASSNSEAWEWRAEAYVGRNTANLGLLGLSFCNASVCGTEAGMYASVKRSFQHWGMFASVGGAAMLDATQVQESYVGTTLAGTGPGIERNWTAHAGIERKLTENAHLWTEISYWNTRHHLAAGATVSPQRDAVLFQLGSQVNL